MKTLDSSNQVIKKAIHTISIMIHFETPSVRNNFKYYSNKIFTTRHDLGIFLTLNSYFPISYYQFLKFWSHQDLSLIYLYCKIHVTLNDNLQDNALYDYAL